MAPAESFQSKARGLFLQGPQYATLHTGLWPSSPLAKSVVLGPAEPELWQLSMCLHSLQFPLSFRHFSRKFQWCLFCGFHELYKHSHLPAHPSWTIACTVQGDGDPREGAKAHSVLANSPIPSNSHLVSQQEWGNDLGPRGDGERLCV